MSTAAAITLAIAVLGAVLGIINTWRSIDASRVKIKVLPAHALAVGGANPAIKFSIAVTNLSTFPVTVDNVGFLYEGTENKAVLVDYQLDQGGTLPVRLEPRTSVSVYCGKPEPMSGHPIKCAFATTACGITCTGSSPALRQVARAAEL